MKKEEIWDINIQPKISLFEVDFKELWHYKDLLEMFVKRNIITQYKHLSVMGNNIMQPLCSTIKKYK